MPELPEVTTIVNQLNRKIKNKRIYKVEVRDAKAINLTIKEFETRLENKTIKKAERRAKLIIWRLSGNDYLVFHLKLNGHILWVDDDQKTHKHTRVIFDLIGSDKIFFDDTRRFGWVRYYDEKGFKIFMGQQGYGSEPLDDSMTLEKFKKMLKDRPRSKIKQLLMDQRFIVGIGNIYSQEICFKAGVMPDRKVEDLSDNEIKKIFKAMKGILKEAVKQQGTSSDVYVDLYGEQGDYVEELNVYGREGEECPGCGSKVKKMKLGGRGTGYCPKCQK